MAISTAVKNFLNKFMKVGQKAQLGTVIQNLQEGDGIDLARGSILVGDSAGVSAAVSAKGDGKILVGDGSDLNSVAVSGDISLTNAGLTAIASGVIVNADVNASAAIALSKLEAVSSARLIVGNGSNVPVAVDVTGDVTISNAGVTAIGAGKVLESMLASATSDALNAKRIARATFDYSTMGATGAHGSGVTLPDNSIIQRAWIDIVSGMTSAGGNGTIAIHAEGANDILAAVDADTLSGLAECIQDGTAANMVKTTAAREITFTVGTENLTAGSFVLFLEYVVSD